MRINPLDAKNTTPYDWAVEAKKPDAAELLRLRGGRRGSDLRMQAATLIQASVRGWYVIYLIYCFSFFILVLSFLSFVIAPFLYLYSVIFFFV